MRTRSNLIRRLAFRRARRAAGVAVGMVCVIAFAGALHGADTCVLAGKVVDGQTGKPVPNVTITLHTTEMDSSRRDRKTIAAAGDGSFKVMLKCNTDVIALWEQQPDSEYLLDMDWLQRNNAHFTRLGVIRQDKTDLVLKIRLRPSSRLTIKVTEPNGQPARNARIFFNFGGGAVATDNSGAFTLLGAPADQDYGLYVASADGKSNRIVHVKCGTESVKIALAPACRMEGRAIAEDKAPAAGLNLEIVPVLGDQPLFRLMGANSCTVGRDGRFVVGNLCAGATYQAFWSAAVGANLNYCEGSKAFKAEEGKTIAFTVKRYRDDWQAAGNIAVSKETKCRMLTNYCLNQEDNILACDAGESAIRVISPEDKLLAKWQLRFAPQAIECRDDGTAVVAGTGKIALLDKNGKVIREAKLPGNTATGVGWSGNDVFVSVQMATGYSIYRMDSRLENHTQIVKGLRGCCGQMDFTAKDGVIYVAANCQFKVAKYDRNGKEIGRFGKRGQGGDEGFQGCCEPKNICFDSKGNLYTAESNRCCVKKFTPDGKFLAHMGAVSGIRGCVRVTIAMPKDCSKIYMLDTGRNIIRVLTPTTKASRG